MPNTSLSVALMKGPGAITMPLSVSLAHCSQFHVGMADTSKSSLIQQSMSRSTVEQGFMILGQSDKPACTINTMPQRIGIHSYY
jgi:hypothetical protein